MKEARMRESEMAEAGGASAKDGGARGWGGLRKGLGGGWKDR